MLLDADHVEGFVERCLRGRRTALRVPAHRVDFVPGGPVLVVTFEPAATGHVDLDAQHPAWAQGLVHARGHTLLGVKREVTNWYRSPALHRLFRALQASGFFRGYERVLFCGPSMGGCAALAFAASAPGCTVLALHPQSTLAPDRVWFDQRFAGPRAAAWAGDFVDGVDGARLAERVYVCYDPYQPKDRLHAERLPRDNLVRLRLPFVGHRTAQALHALGLLGAVLDGVLAHTLDEPGFRAMARARVGLADYHCRLAERGHWPPRRERHLALALALDGGHERARRLQQVLHGGHGLSAGGPPRPARWPAGLVGADGLPLVYLGVPLAGQEAIEHLMREAAGGPALRRPWGELRRGSEDNDDAHALITRQLDLGALVFTFVRHPGERALACFERLIHPASAPPAWAGLRQALAAQGHLPAPGQAWTLARRQQGFIAFLRDVQASLAGDPALPPHPAWCPQGPMLVHCRKFLRIGVVGRVENFAADMALVLHKAGVRHIPDVHRAPWRADAAGPGFAEVLTPEAQVLLDQLYGADYKHLGYPARPT